MPRLKNGMARVEFLAVRAEAEALLAKGHPASGIYERFKADGKISMSYAAFHRHLKGAPKKATPNKTPEVSAPSAPPVSAKAVEPEVRKPSVPLPHAPRRIGATFGTDAWRKKDIPSAADLTIKPIPESSPESGEA